MGRVWWLALALAVWPMTSYGEALTATEARTLADAGDLTIVDVRMPAEWAKTGLPAGAMAVALQNPATLQPRPDFIDDLLAAVDGDRDRPLALICATGMRSAFAASLLAQAGFTRVHNIDEGMQGSPTGPGWLQRELPTEPCEVC